MFPNTDVPDEGPKVAQEEGGGEYQGWVKGKGRGGASLGRERQGGFKWEGRMSGKSCVNEKTSKADGYLLQSNCCSSAAAVSAQLVCTSSAALQLTTLTVELTFSVSQ